MNPDKLIDLWESNRFELATALRSASGDPDTILSLNCWREVLMVLAKNNIRIEARYIGDHDD